MSYDNTVCPCGGEKPPSTMLCDLCEADLAARPEMATFKSDLAPEYRRHAAIILVSLARDLGRKRKGGG